MSDNGQQAPAAAGEIKFTDKEERVLKVVWACMKEVPEVDLAKLTVAAGFQTQKTCSNTWGQIRKKLMMQAAANGVEVNMPSRSNKSPKKRVKSEVEPQDSADEGATETPTKPKKARKSPTKKAAIVKKEELDERGEIGDGDDDSASLPASPTKSKKASVAPIKKEATVKEEALCGKF